MEVSIYRFASHPHESRFTIHAWYNGNRVAGGISERYTSALGIVDQVSKAS
jgi:hypothetical protein